MKFIYTKQYSDDGGNEPEPPDCMLFNAQMFKFADDFEMTELSGFALSMWERNNDPFDRQPEDYHSIVRAIYNTLRTKDDRLRGSLVQKISVCLYELLRRGFPVFAMMSELKELASGTAAEVMTSSRRPGWYECSKCDFVLDISGIRENM